MCVLLLEEDGRKLYESEKVFKWDGKIDGELCPAGNYIVYLEFEGKSFTKVINLMY